MDPTNIKQKRKINYSVFFLLIFIGVHYKTV